MHCKICVISKHVELCMSVPVICILLDIIWYINSTYILEQMFLLWGFHCLNYWLFSWFDLFLTHYWLFFVCWQGDENDSLIRLFLKLKELLNQVGDLRHLDPNHYFGMTVIDCCSAFMLAFLYKAVKSFFSLLFLDPFLEVIRSEETTGPVTSLALASVAKFLSYNLLGKK